jgi:hypothetical protein
MRLLDCYFHSVFYYSFFYHNILPRFITLLKDKLPQTLKMQAAIEVQTETFFLADQDKSK